MKHYQVVGFEEGYPVFWFNITVNNFSEALRTIDSHYYVTHTAFQRLEITEVEND